MLLQRLANKTGPKSSSPDTETVFEGVTELFAAKVFYLFLNIVLNYTAPLYAYFEASEKICYFK